MHQLNSHHAPRAGAMQAADQAPRVHAIEPVPGKPLTLANGINAACYVRATVVSYAVLTWLKDAS